MSEDDEPIGSTAGRDEALSRSRHDGGRHHVHDLHAALSRPPDDLRRQLALEALDRIDGADRHPDDAGAPAAVVPGLCGATERKRRAKACLDDARLAESSHDGRDAGHVPPRGNAHRRNVGG